MKVFLTGAGGFVGRRLQLRLLEEGHSVTAYDISPADPALSVEGPDVRYITGNLAHGDLLQTIDWHHFDVVVHLAAAGVKASSRSWDSCVVVNVVGTQQLLAALARCWRTPLLFFPRTFYQDWLARCPALSGNPYVSTKAAAERLVGIWVRNTPNARVVFGTFFQTYGPGDDPGNVLSYAVNQLSKGQLAKFGSGTGVRDWIYLDDLVNGIIASIEFALPSVSKQVFRCDLGSGEGHPIREVVERVAKKLGAPVSLLDFDPSRDRGDENIVSTSQDAVPGWRCAYSLDEGLLALVQGTRGKV